MASGGNLCFRQRFYTHLHIKSFTKHFDGLGIALCLSQPASLIHRQDRLDH